MWLHAHTHTPRIYSSTKVQIMDNVLHGLCAGELGEAYVMGVMNGVQLAVG